MIKREYYTPSDSYKLFSIALFVFFAVSTASSSIALTAKRYFQVNLFANGYFVWILTALGTLSLFVVVLIYCKVDKICLVKASKLNVKPTFTQIIAGIMCLAGLLFLVLPLANFFTAAIEKVGLPVPEVTLPDVGEVGNIICMVVFACILPAFCEELLMRGVIANGLARKGKIKAALISGILFALFHMNPAQTVYQFALGFAMGYFVLHSGNLWIAMIMHFLNNLTAVVLDLTMSLELQQTVFMDNLFITMPLGALLIFGAVLILIKRVPDKFDAEHELHVELATNKPVTRNEVYDEFAPTVAEVIDADFSVMPPLRKVTRGEKIFFRIALILCVIMWFVTLFIG